MNEYRMLGPHKARTADQNNNGTQNKVVWRIVAGGVLVVLVILFVSICFPLLQERTKFFTENALSALVLTAIVVQAYIYTKQWKAMQSGLTETRNLVAQNERSIAVAKESVEVARKAFYVGEAPYFGTSRIRFHWARGKPDHSGDRGETGRAQVVITFMNGGRTPAWHFSAIPHLELGELSQEQKKWVRMKAVNWRDCPEAENTFYPSGAQKCIAYEALDEFSPSEIEAIKTQKQMLFLIIDIGYTDINSDRTTRQFLRCLNPTTQAFSDCGTRQDYKDY